MNAVTQQKEQKTARPQPETQEQLFVSPNVNIFETRDAYILEAEMPGVAKDGLNLSVEDNVLTITGRRQPDASFGLMYRESSPVDYRRVFELDPSIETGRIDARMEQGVLTLTLPDRKSVV